MREKKTVLTIKGRLFGMTIILGLGFLVIGFLLFNSFNHIKAVWTKYGLQTAQKERVISLMKTYLGYGGIIHYYKDFIIHQDPADRRKIEKSYESFGQLVSKYLNLPNVSTEETANIMAIYNTIELYKDNIPQVETLFKMGKKFDEVDTLVAVNDAPALKAFKWFENNFDKALATGAKEIDRSLKAIEYQMIGMLFFILLILIFLSLLTGSVISRKLNKILLMTSGIAEGDLSKTISVRQNDELGKLARNFNLAVASLRDIIGSVKETSKKTREISVSLLENADETHSSVSSISGEIDSVEQESESLNEKIASASSALEEIKQGSGEMQIGANGISSVLLDIKAVSSRNLESVRNISADASKINEAVGKISTLSTSNDENSARLHLEVSKFKTEI